MAVIVDNTSLTADVFRLTVLLDAPVTAVPGQFCMVNAPGAFLPRPISIHDLSDAGDMLTFLIHARGTGTKRMAREFQPGGAVEVSPPLGTGLAVQDAPLTLVGGGVGTAPLLYLARRWQQRYPARQVRVYLGFAAEPFALEGWEALGLRPVVNVGGLITDEMEVCAGNVVFACGPDAMMRAVYQKTARTGQCYVSLERRMACGVGACLGCTIPARGGNRRVCKDGPVFLGEDVYEI